MEDETAKLIKKFLDKLKVNDEKEAYEFEEPPREPTEAINALVNIGRPAVKPLLEMLKDTSKYSCLYAIKILGELRDPRAVQPIIHLLFSDDFDHAFGYFGEFQQPIVALQKIGHIGSTI